MSKHTPLPWNLAREIDGLHAGWKTWVIGNGIGIAVCNNQTRSSNFRACQKEAEANAELIVTAVNNHNKLSESLKLVVERFPLNDWLDEDEAEDLRALVAQLDGE